MAAEIPSFRAFVVDRDDRFDGKPPHEHPGVWLGLGPPNAAPQVGYAGCGLCLAVTILEQLYCSPEHAAAALAEVWHRPPVEG